jgi:predicted adenine nucleotide alpha hydrolase (AANH) superfamily ATPase
MKKRRLLLHVCCGPCATHPIILLRDEYDITLFFANSNISPKDEYKKRLLEAQRLATICDLPLKENKYNHNKWLAWISGNEQEPEGGKRCEKCFEYNLSIAAEYAISNSFDLFTTTLTVSPHKNSKLIFDIGEKAGPFLAVDLKKKDGYKKGVELSKTYNLYRQNYCGCEFSLAERQGNGK